LILEDDAVFAPDFTRRVLEFLTHVPDDWEMLYLGGQHLGARKNPPRQVNPFVYEPFNVNRTHAFAVRGQSFIAYLYQFLHEWHEWTKAHHIDHHLGRLHEMRQRKIYCPREWLVGQAEGQSNINGRVHDQRFWPSSREASQLRRSEKPFVAVIGLHSSGSSALAGMLYYLGLHLGNQLGGYYGTDPQNSCGFEAAGLAQICEQAIPFPQTVVCLEPDAIVQRLETWIRNRRREADRRGLIAGGKYPMLCRLGPYLQQIEGDKLLIIDCQRPLDESISSLIRRLPQPNPEILAHHQRWLWDGKQEFLAQFPEDGKLTVKYAELLAQPRVVAERLISFLNIKPTEDQVTCAVRYVDPARRHVG
jgi:hypothetical protein